MKDLVKTLKRSFKDKEYRHGYVDEFLNAYIATQIKVLREQRGWSQKELADNAGMLQPRISVMENVNYSSWSIKILRAIAEAFDLTLRVSFEEFGTRVDDIKKFSRESIERYSFADDPYFKESTVKEIALRSTAPGIMGCLQQQTYSQPVEQGHFLGITATAAMTMPAITLTASATATTAAATMPSKKVIHLRDFIAAQERTKPETEPEKDTPKTIADYFGNNPPTKVVGDGAMSAISGL